MSDQETAIQLIRNEAAELVTRAKAAGLSVLVFNGPDGTIVDTKPLELKIRVHTFVSTAPPPTPPSLPQGNFFFCSGHRDPLKPDNGNRRYFAIDLDVEPSASGTGVHVFAKEPDFADMQEGLAQAEEMNRNMQQFGTIDKPAAVKVQK